MRSKLRKAGCVISALCVMLTMSGCFILSDLLTPTKNMKAITKAIEEDDFVEEWNGEVPSGMKVKYVLVKDQRVFSGDSLHHLEYGYDAKGRRTVLKDVRENGFIRYENIYNDAGQLIGKKQRREGTIKGAPVPDIDLEFKYNDRGQIVSYTNTYESRTVEYGFQYDEDGHLVSSSENGKVMMKYESDFKNLPYYESSVVLDDDFNEKGPSVVKRTYDENGLILTEETDACTRTFEYKNGKYAGYTSKTRSSTVVYDANGNIVQSYMGGENNSEVKDYEYNDHGDLIHYKVTRKGEVTYRSDHMIEYDSNGNKISDTTKIWSKNSGEESNSVITTKYTYDKHGLLTVEAQTKDDGKTSYLNVFYYKAILVPEE